MKNKKCILIFAVILILILSIYFITKVYLKDILSAKEKYSKVTENINNDENIIQENNLTNDKADTRNSFFEDSSIEGITPITEEEAIAISNTYIETNKIISSYEILKIEQGEEKPNNHISINYIDGKENEMVANFSRKCYVIYYKEKENMENLETYIDMYTGKVIGGYLHGI